MSNIPLPQAWPKAVCSAMVRAVALASYVRSHLRSIRGAGVGELERRDARIEQLEAELALVHEEARIKDARMARVPPRHRPHYLPEERLAILAHQAARRWNQAQTADAFQVTPATIATWSERADDGDLVATRTPVNRFPDFVREMLAKLRATVPCLGRRKLADMLARAGLNISASSVRRMGRERGARPTPPEPQAATAAKPKRIVARGPNHTWHLDLTTASIGAGFWVPWLPLSVLQWWPFCWWLVVVMDSYSRKLLAVRAFFSQPSSLDVCRALDRAVVTAGAPPKYCISDQGGQFTADDYATWCQTNDVEPRFGAVGKHGSIALVERAILTLKTLLDFVVLPFWLEPMQHELDTVALWYNEHRPHDALGGETPNERFFGSAPARASPRFEPWSRIGASGKRATAANAALRAQPGTRFEGTVEYLHGRKHLPIISLRKAA